MNLTILALHSIDVSEIPTWTHPSINAVNDVVMSLNHIALNINYVKWVVSFVCELGPYLVIYEFVHLFWIMMVWVLIYQFLIEYLLECWIFTMQTMFRYHDIFLNIIFVSSKSLLAESANIPRVHVDSQV